MKEKQPKISILWGQFEAYLRGVYSQSTYNSHANRLGRFFRYFKNKRYPDQLTRVDVENYIAARVAEGFTESGAYRDVMAIRAFYKWMFDVMELPVIDPTRGLINPKYKSVKLIRPQLLSLKHIHALLAAAKDNLDDSLLLWFFLSTGRTAKEAATLRWDAVDLERGELRFGSSTLPIRQELLTLLRRKVQLSVREKGNEFVFGGGLACRIILRWRKFCDKNGLARLDFRLLRKTFEALVFLAGGNETQLRSLLGNAEVEIEPKLISSLPLSQTVAPVEPVLPIEPLHPQIAQTPILLPAAQTEQEGLTVLARYIGKS